MKKIYSIVICMLGISAISFAQCTITSATVTPNGLSVNAVMIANGATVPYYAWDWGDATSPSTTQTASHTYASAGMYTVCAVYLDLANSSCLDTMCQQVTVSAVGIAEANDGVNSVSASPNPFGLSTTFHVNLVQNSNVEISVYDVTGQLVQTVKNGQMAAGQHEVVWAPANLADGVYFVQMVVDGAVTTKRIVHTSAQ
jgi:PKD repeat protein